MNLNAKYKDSVFSFLFSDPDLLRELYGALEDISLPPDVPIIINTLEGVLFMDLINDISFEIGGKLVVLIEHQSSINPNMPLRLLMYIARVYEKMMKDKKQYSSKRILIPRPEFFVLYNGTAPYPDEEKMWLSEAFENPETLGLSQKAEFALDLEVRVININEGHNSAIARRCKKLAEYSAFIAKVRYFEREKCNKEAGMKEAIKYCRENDILKEFLEENATEVINMLLAEWNLEDAKEVWREEAREEGREEGLEEGLEKGREEIAQNMLRKGFSFEQIAELSGLDIERVRELSNRI